MRIMAIDYGDARTGVAISDITAFLCGEAFVITEYDMQRLADKIAELVREREIGELVLGLPLNMDASMGERAEKCHIFAALLEEKTGLKPVLWDERRTTVDAHRILSENDRRGKRRKQTVDAVAASLILEGYLLFLERKSKQKEL